MSELLQVPTHFEDIAALSEGLADRIEPDRLILYGPRSYTEGDRIPFAVYLLDGNPALEGTGQVAVAVDGGEDRAAETRFDIVLEDLAFDARSEVIVERILLGRSSLTGEATGEVPVDEVPTDDVAEEGVADEVSVDLTSAADAEAPPAEASPPALPGDGAVDLVPDEMPASGAAPALDAPALSDGVLRRPMHPPAWTPAPGAAPAPGPSTGAFSHAAGPLPVPSAPPFPELAPEERVAPAPRPGDEMPTPSLVAAAEPAAAAAPMDATPAPADDAEPPEEAERDDPTPVDVDLDVHGEAEDTP